MWTVRANMQHSYIEPFLNSTTEARRVYSSCDTGHTVARFSLHFNLMFIYFFSTVFCSYISCISHQQTCSDFIYFNIKHKLSLISSKTISFLISEILYKNFRRRAGLEPNQTIYLCLSIHSQTIRPHKSYALFHHRFPKYDKFLLSHCYLHLQNSAVEKHLFDFVPNLFISLFLFLFE